jgi:hypothetical protein
MAKLGCGEAFETKHVSLSIKHHEILSHFQSKYDEHIIFLFTTKAQAVSLFWMGSNKCYLFFVKATFCSCKLLLVMCFR